MLLRRRKKESIGTRLRVAMWPRRSWVRSVEYIKKRMLRLRATPHGIAAGFAAGVFASFTPMMGFHFIIAALLAWLTRGSLIASAFGTFVGNPLTFPIIWSAIYAVGSRIIGGVGPDADVNLTHYFTWSEFSFAALWPILQPMLLGGIVLGSIGWSIVYFPVRALVARYQEARRALLAERMDAPIEETTDRGVPAAK